jgi:dTMP kinase
MALFIVIEGLDGSGGSTQVRRLVDRLSAHSTREPSDGVVGRLIRSTLADPDGLDNTVLPALFAADRTDHLVREIEPALARGQHVVSDRYLHSSLAYQSLAMPLDQVFALNEGFRVPDLTVYLALDVDTCMARIDARGLDKDRFEKREQLQAISASYDRVLALLSERGDPIVRLDASQSIDQVEAALWAHVEPLL